VTDEATGHDTGNGPNPITIHHALILRLLRSVARRHRLTADETDELRSLVHLKLVENDGVAFRRFEGRSSLATYLTKIIWRCHLDRQIEEWGKWRPSVQARRQGATAVRLERLLQRDHLPFEEACEVILASGRAPETRGTLERMRASFPYRHRVRVHGQDVLDALPASALSVTPVFDGGESEAARLALRRKLARALVSLPRGDRQLLRLRYRRGWKMARVASTLRLNPKRTYREFERVHRTLRTMLVDSSTSAAPAQRGARPT